MGEGVGYRELKELSLSEPGKLQNDTLSTRPYNTCITTQLDGALNKMNDVNRYRQCNAPRVYVHDVSQGVGQHTLQQQLLLTLTVPIDQCH